MADTTRRSGVRLFPRGLRAKTVALLLIAALAYAAVVLLVGNDVLNDIRQDLGTSLAHNGARQSQQRILAKVGQELALSLRLAESITLRDWMADEDDPVKRERFFREGENFRRAFQARSYFIALRDSRHYYFADEASAPKAALRYTIRRDDPDEAWFFHALEQPGHYWINVDSNKTIGQTNLWIDVTAIDPDSGKTAVTGTGIDLTRFLADFFENAEPGVTTMILDDAANIVAHPDPGHIQINLASTAKDRKTLFRLATSSEDERAMREMMEDVRVHPDHLPIRTLSVEGAPRLVAMARVPTLNWTVATEVDTTAGGGLTARRIIEVGGVAALSLLLFLVIASLGFERLVLRPLSALTASVRRIGEGDFSVRLHSDREDEVGELTRAFDVMAQKVRAHSEHLERMVAARTSELADANARIMETNRKLTDSIRYASLIQSAILPDRQLRENFSGQYFILWRPRDVVGGDFYIYRGNEDGCLFGVVDCAGHGVPGACMTMIAHAAMEVALGDTPWDDPSALLRRVDAVARSMLPGDDRNGLVATNMDMGLAYVNLRQREVRFAGAHMALFWSDGTDCHSFPGDRRGVNDRKPGSYEVSSTALLPGRTFYLATDGLLDQAGGANGFSFGQRRFAEWVVGHATLSLDDQKARLIETLDNYRGDRVQRDDITVLAFRFEDLR